MSGISILMYHSISEAGGPTSIAPDTFSMQMRVLSESGREVVSLDEVSAARSGGPSLPDGAVVLTFDDAFDDFATTAWPEISARGWPVTVYVPTDRVGGVEDWEGGLTPPRPLMDWETIARLAEAGVDFGGHSLTHPDLSRLSGQALSDQVAGPVEALKARTGRIPRHFAPPYGRSNKPVRDEIARHYASSCGTVLGLADGQHDLYDLPRIEMFYYQDEGHWRRHLAGRGKMYLGLRRALRRTRQVLTEARP